MTRSEPADSSDRTWFRVKLFAALLGVVAFANVPLNGYCYDDRLIVETSRRVSGERPWHEIWLTDYWSEARPNSPQRDLLYRPVSVSTFRLVHMFAGSAPWAQHTVNVVLHALACLCIVILARRLGLSPGAGFIGGALFAVLPIHTDVVANAVGRCDLLAAAGVIVAILLHRRTHESATRGANFNLRVASSIVALLAMGAKENAVIVVALVPLLDLCGSLSKERFNPVPHLVQHTRRALRYAPLVIAGGAYLSLRYVALGGRFVQDPPISRSVNVLVDAPAWQHALGVVQLWGMYWAKTLWPSVLSIGYSINTIRLTTSPTNAYVLLGLAVLVALAFVSVRSLQRGNRIPSALAACIILAYLPTANAAVPLQVFFAERLWYGPSIWVALLVGALAAELLRNRMAGVARAVVYAAASVLLCAMVLRCWTRNTDWRDEGRLLATAVRDQPEGVAALQLYGQHLVNQGQFADAIPLLERALRIDLGFTDAYTSLAQAQLGLGRFEEALRTLATVEQQFPGQERTRRMTATARAGLAGAAESELAPLRASAQSRPDDLDAELALVRALREQGHGREALDRLRSPRPAFEAASAWRYERAVTLAMHGERDDAIVAYGRLLDLDEANVQARVELAMLLLERRASGDVELADSTLRPAEGVARDSPNVLAARAEWFAAQGRIHEAIAAYRRAVSAVPPASPQRSLFEQRMRSLGG